MNFLYFLIAHAKEISLLVVAITGSITAIVGLCSYKLKVKAENNLKLKNEAEIDIKVIKQFSELITVANGRSGYVLSESAVEHYLSKYTSLSGKNSDDIKLINKNLESLAILTNPVGKASQDATAVSLTDFAVKNPILRDAAIIGIETLPIDTEIQKQCLKKLRA